MPHLGPCWTWRGSATGSLGYGQFTLNANGTQRHIYAHRYAWELERGPVPDGLEVMHHCDNPRCVRPDHLSPATRLENTRDCAAKGRLNVPRPRSQKVTDAQLAEMLNLLALGRKRVEIARQFGVSKTYVTRLAQGTLRQYSLPPVAAEKAS